MGDLKEHTISLAFACVVDTLSGFKKRCKISWLNISVF